jgi:O-antigen ligase
VASQAPEQNPPREAGTDGAAHGGARWGIGSLIALAIFLYFWIGISPLAGRGGDDTAAPTTNLLNQFVVVFLSLIVLLAIWRNAARGTLLAPHGLLFILLCWFSCVSLFASSPETAFRRIIFAILVCLCANAALLLPRNSREFDRVLAIAMTAALALSYFAIFLLPNVGIHQSDEMEAALAGDWRGHFGHKNAAAAAMAYAVLIGLYLRKTYYPKLGTVIVILSAVFLYFAGGKTSTAVLPAVLMVAWVFEHWRSMRYVIVLGALLVLNYILIGSAINPSLANWLASLGIDSTFTGRNTIWTFALDKISERPWMGFGFQSFWESAAFKKNESLTFLAAHSHNSFLETIINAGIPGLMLVFVWLLLLPIRDAGRAFAGQNDPVLTRLFLRVWLFSICLACLESLFFVNGGPSWFTMLMGVFGLRLQARSMLGRATQPGTVDKPAVSLGKQRLA